VVVPDCGREPSTPRYASSSDGQPAIDGDRSSRHGDVARRVRGKKRDRVGDLVGDGTMSGVLISNATDTYWPKGLELREQCMEQPERPLPHFRELR